jgi:hypothetical protein
MTPISHVNIVVLDVVGCCFFACLPACFECSLCTGQADQKVVMKKEKEERRCTLLPFKGNISM